MGSGGDKGSRRKSGVTMFDKTVIKSRFHSNYTALK